MKSAVLCLLILLSVSVNSYSEIYQWVDESGQTHLSNQKPADETKLKAFKILADQPEAKATHITAPKTIQQPIKQAPKPIPLILYTADWCSQCRQARSYLRHKHISFQDYNVETSHKGAVDYKRMGSGKLPIMILNGNTSRGFNIKRFEQQWQQANKNHEH